MKKILMALVAVLLTATVAGAQSNLASKWTVGPSIPFFTGEFDSVGNHGGFHGGLLAQGAGVMISRQLKANDAGDVTLLGVGFPIYGTFQGGDPSNFRLMPGAALTFYNQLFALGAAVKFIDVAPGRAPVGLFDGVDRTDLVLLASFSINIGNGTPPPEAALYYRSVGAAAAALPKPPNYWRPW